MHEDNSHIEPDPDGDAPPEEFRADPNEHWPLLIICAVLAVLSAVGVGWSIVKPGEMDGGLVFSILFLAALGAGFGIGAYVTWLKLRRRYRLREGGLEYFDGRQTHEIDWGDVAEIYEVISSNRLLGINVTSPDFQVVFVTVDGVRGEINKYIEDSGTIAPIVSDEVNRSLRKRARKRLKRGGSVAFGCLRLSEAGIGIEEPPSKTLLEFLKHGRGNVNKGVAVPGEYAWDDVRDIRLARAIHGSRLADHSTYNELQIRVNGRKDPVFTWGIPEFPNFTLFEKVLKALGHELEASA